MYLTTAIEYHCLPFTYTISVIFLVHFVTIPEVPDPTFAVIPVEEAPGAKNFLAVAVTFITLTLAAMIGLDLISIKTDVMKFLKNIKGIKECFKRNH